MKLEDLAMPFNVYSRFLCVLVLLATSHLMVAQRATPIGEIEGLFYTVQIGTYASAEIPAEIQELSDINVEAINGSRYRYSSGIYRDIKFARTYREELLGRGFKGAFVIAYENGKRVSLRILRERVLADQRTPETREQEEAPTLLPIGSDVKAFDFELKSGSVLSEATREVSDLFENQILDYSQRKTRPDTNQVIALYTKSFDSLTRYQYDSAYLQAQADRYRGNWGLDFNTWYIYNFEPGIDPVNENVFFRQRVNLTLNWDVLNNGLYKNRLQAKRLENELRIRELQQQELSSRDRLEDVYNYIIYLYNVEKLQAIDERVNLLNRQVQIIEMLYTTKDRTWEEIIDLKARIVRTESMYRKWQNYNTILRDNILPGSDLGTLTSSAALPVLDPVPQKLFRQNLQESDYYEELIRLQSENVDYQYNRLQDVSLRPFVRYNVVADDTVALRTFSSAGVSLTLPINFKGNNEVKRYKKLYLESVHYKKEKDDNHELLNYYYEYQFKLEQLYEFHYNQHKIEERLRKEIIKYQLGDESFSPLRAIGYMDELMAVKVEIIDIRQNLYLRLLKIMEYVDSDSPLDFCEEVPMDELLFRYQQKRSVYVWSKFFNAQDNIFLIHYLNNNEFKQVFLSPGRNPNEDKIRDFIRLAKRYNVEVHAMVGSNSYALEVDSAKLADVLTQYRDLGFSGVHLDIEPQTFPDWEGNRSFYLNNLISTYRISQRVLTGYSMKLSGSIPVYYPEDALARLYPLCDQVYLMAYERPDIEFIKRKTREEFLLDPEKTTLALRTKDFENRLVMEKFIEALDEEMDLTKLAIHDLGTLFDLDYTSSMEAR